MQIVSLNYAHTFWDPCHTNTKLLASQYNGSVRISSVLIKVLKNYILKTKKNKTAKCVSGKAMTLCQHWPVCVEGTCVCQLSVGLISELTKNFTRLMDMLFSSSLSSPHLSSFTEFIHKAGCLWIFAVFRYHTAFHTSWLLPRQFCLLLVSVLSNFPILIL